jgi:hypothetical protein
MVDEVDALTLIEFTFDLKEVLAKALRADFVDEPEVFIFFDLIKEPCYEFNTRVEAGV